MRAFGVDRGLPFPLADIGRADTLLLVGANVAETMPPFGALPDRAAGARRHAHRDRPAGHRRPPGRPTLHLQPTPGHRPGAGQRAAAHRDRRGLARRGRTSTRAPPASTRCAAAVAGYWPARVERLTGVPVADLDAAADAARPRAGTRDHPHRPRRRAARQGRRHGHRVRSTWRSRSACPAGRAPATAASPARATARAAASTGRRPTSCPATGSIDDPAARAHVAGGLGRRPGRPARPGRLGVRAARLAGHARTGRRRCWCSAPTRSSPRPGPRRVEQRLPRLDLLVVADFVLSETAALADVVLPTAQWAEEDGTMTNLEGRVLRRQRAAPAAARGADRPGGARRAGRPARAAARGSPPTRGPSSTSCGGPRPAGRPTTPASPGSGSTPRTACSGPARRADQPGTPRLFAERFATAGRAGPVRRRSSTGPPAEEVDADYPLYLTTGRVLAQYQSGAQTRRIGAAAHAPRRGRSSSCTPTSPPGSASSDGDAVRVTSRRGEMTAPGPADRDDPARHRLRPVPLGRRRRGPTRSPTTRSTRSRGCRSSRSAPSEWSGRMRVVDRRLRHGRARGWPPSCAPGTPT